MKKIIKIILDTNFLLIPFQFKIDIFSELDRLMMEPFELCIIDKTIDELKKIIETQAGKNRDAAKFALKLIDTNLFKVLKTLKTEKNLNVDQLILKLLKEGEFIVATQDKALKREIKVLNVSLIVLRQKRYLKLI